MLKTRQREPVDVRVSFRRRPTCGFHLGTRPSHRTCLIMTKTPSRWIVFEVGLLGEGLLNNAHVECEVVPGGLTSGAIQFRGRSPAQVGLEYVNIIPRPVPRALAAIAPAPAIHSHATQLNCSLSRCQRVGRSLSPISALTCTSLTSKNVLGAFLFSLSHPKTLKLQPVLWLYLGIHP